MNFELSVFAEDADKDRGNEQPEEGDSNKEALDERVEEDVVLELARLQAVELGHKEV